MGDGAAGLGGRGRAPAALEVDRASRPPAPAGMPQRWVAGDVREQALAVGAEAGRQVAVELEEEAGQVAGGHLGAAPVAGRHLEAAHARPPRRPPPYRRRRPARRRRWPRRCRSSVIIESSSERVAVVERLIRRARSRRSSAASSSALETLAELNCASGRAPDAALASSTAKATVPAPPPRRRGRRQRSPCGYGPAASSAACRGPLLPDPAAEPAPAARSDRQRDRGARQARRSPRLGDRRRPMAGRILPPIRQRSRPGPLRGRRRGRRQGADARRAWAGWRSAPRWRWRRSGPWPRSASATSRRPRSRSRGSPAAATSCWARRCWPRSTTRRACAPPSLGQRRGGRGRRGDFRGRARARRRSSHAPRCAGWRRQCRRRIAGLWVAAAPR